jgi:hypothetical protein
VPALLAPAAAALVPCAVLAVCVCAGAVCAEAAALAALRTGCTGLAGLPKKLVMRLWLSEGSGGAFFLGAICPASNRTWCSTATMMAHPALSFSISLDYVR